MSVYGLPPDGAAPSLDEVRRRGGHGFVDNCQQCGQPTAPLSVAKQYPDTEGGILVYECVSGHHWTCAWSWAS
jgi:hypothetical protein